MTKQLKLSALFVALVASGTAMASEAHTKHGYVVSSQSQEVVRNNYGECWKSTYFDKETQGRRLLNTLKRLCRCLPKHCSALTKIFCVLKLRKV